MKRKTLRERCDESIRAVLRRTQSFPGKVDWMVYEHERQMWLAGYRAKRQAHKGKP